MRRRERQNSLHVVCRIGLHVCWLVIAVAVVGATNATGAQKVDGVAPASIPLPNAMPLAEGDAIRLAFWREQTLSGDYPVDERGMVVLPLIGERQVTHVHPGELKQMLIADYARQFTTPQVQITLLRRVSIVGTVKTPGLYHLDPTMTVAEAVALAGGPTIDGKLRDIRVMRGDVEIRSSVGDGVRLMEHVRSGDQIVVPERSWFARNGALILASVISALGFFLGQIAF